MWGLERRKNIASKDLKMTHSRIVYAYSCTKQQCVNFIDIHIRRVDAAPGPLGRIGHALAVWPVCEAKNP